MNPDYNPVKRNRRPPRESGKDVYAAAAIGEAGFKIVSQESPPRVVPAYSFLLIGTQIALW